jgi:hypothetical protein
MSNNRNSNTPDPDKLIERLQPKLQQLEQTRLDIRQKALKQMGAIAALAIVVALVLALIIGIGTPNSGIGVFALFGGMAWIVILVPRGQKKWKEQAQRELAPIVCEAIDDNLDYQSEVSSGEFVKPFEVLELVGEWNLGGAEHHFRGQHRDMKFEMAHGDLRSSRGTGKDSGTVPVFYGLLCRVQVPLEVDPGLSIRPNFGWFSKTFGKHAVATGDEQFDKSFLVSVENNSEKGPEVIKRVLTPELRESLLTINAREGKLAYNRPTFHAGFKYDSFYLALTFEEEGRSFGPIRTERRRHFLDVGHYLARESKLESGIKRMIDDINTIYRVIDMLEPAF